MVVFKLCVVIFFCRILDVSMGTIRTICTVKGKLQFSVFIGFLEVLIWFLVVREALNTDITSIWVALSYAGGYAAGTLVGGLLARRFVKTQVSVQIITNEGNKDLIREIRSSGFGCTSLTAYGKSSQDKKYMIFVETNSTKVRTLKRIVISNDKNAFITVNESKDVTNGYFNIEK